jgi:hypothetical protein
VNVTQSSLIISRGGYPYNFNCIHDRIIIVFGTIDQFDKASYIQSRYKSIPLRLVGPHDQWYERMAYILILAPYNRCLIGYNIP